MVYNRRKIGSCYEDIAAAFLQQNGYQILTRNYYGRHGEIDIVARDMEYLVFIEVKYRLNTKNGMPAESVSYYKRQNIIHTAREYIYKYGISEDTPVRFDVISILERDIKIIKNAFEV